MKVRFFLERSSNGQFYFTIRARNGRVLATSETYHRRGACRRAAELIADSEVVEIQDRTGSTKRRR